MASNFLFLIAIILPISLHAQKQVVEVPDYWETGTEGTLNNAVDSVINAGTLSNTVFKLKLYGTYVLNGSIITHAGQTLEIVADEPGNTQETAPPMICWTASTTPSKTYLFDIAGEIKMKNVWILWASLDGSRYNSTIRIGDSVTVSGGRCEFENVLFDYVQQIPSGAIQPFATHFKGYFRNCYFKNGADAHFRYYSRVVSVPYTAQGIHIDTLSFENCTFANFGYVYMQENGVYGDNIFFNHCTFYNIVMFTLESGWWWKMYVTNSLFINTFMYGYYPNISAFEGVEGGTVSISPMDSSDALGPGFGFVPDWNPRDGIADFTEQDRRILFAHNNYYLDKWLVDWMWNSPGSISSRRNGYFDNIPVPQPMFNTETLRFFDSVDVGGKKVFPYMNRSNLYEGINITPTCSVAYGTGYTYPIVSLHEEYNPGFLLPPSDTTAIKIWLGHKWDDSWDGPWAWKPENSYNQRWPLEENLSYTNDTLKIAGMGGFPLGDLYRWWPEKYQQWKAQKRAENDTINKWLHYGFSSAVSVNEHPVTPLKYDLGQNFPNPFNPTTQIKYSIPYNRYVTLKVYNLLGQEVATLFEGVRQPGNYEATFDGSKLASGMYIYRLQAGEFTLSKKLIMLK